MAKNGDEGGRFNCRLLAPCVASPMETSGNLRRLGFLPRWHVCPFGDETAANRRGSGSAEREMREKERKSLKQKVVHVLHVINSNWDILSFRLARAPFFFLTEKFHFHPSLKPENCPFCPLKKIGFYKKWPKFKENCYLAGLILKWVIIFSKLIILSQDKIIKQI